jgi:hypothetical protein
MRDQIDTNGTSRAGFDAMYSSSVAQANMARINLTRSFPSLWQTSLAIP